jgi:hypothetical protein
VNKIKENIKKLEIKHKRKICYCVEEKQYYFFGVEFENSFILYELSGGGAPFTHFKDDTTLIFSETEDVSQKTPKNTPKSAQNNPESTSKIPQNYNKNAQNYLIKTTKKGEFVDIIVPHSWKLNKRIYTQYSYQQEDFEKKAVLKDFEDTITNMINQGKQTYNYEKIIKNIYFPAVKSLENGNIDKVINYRNKLLISADKQQKGILENKRQIKKRMIKRIFRYAKYSVIFIGVFYLFYIIRKPARQSEQQQTTEIQIEEAIDANLLIKEFEDNNNFEFTDYRLNLIYSNLPEEYTTEQVNKIILYYYNDLKK